ncbi:hypothetical protein ACP70R_041505 [Stipagrostis hirtigluma subsp. patula]
MAMRTRTGLVLPVIVAAMLLSAAGLGAARPLDGDGWAVVGAGPLQPGGGAASIVDALRRLYLQQLGGPGPSCQTNSPNNGCPP